MSAETAAPAHWPRVALGGLLGEAVAASRRGRLSRFITDGSSPAIAVFAPGQVARNLEGDWYGEHAGKWLVAAARAAAQSGDAALTAQVLRVAGQLIAWQQPDGYLGTYAAQRRFSVPLPEPSEPAPLPTWDGAPRQRTWDAWTHAYMVLGLLEVHLQLGHPGALQAARRIGDLFWHSLSSGAVRIIDLGNHHGMSATVWMDPAMALHQATGEQRYLDLALLVLEQANRHPALALVPRALAGADAAEIATGKAYQLAWNLVGLAKIHQATRRPEHARALLHLWHSIREHHLTLGGGPWGGVAHRSREVFNAPGSFDPQAYVETCSSLAWMQLNRALLDITGDARHAEEIERTAYNDLLGAMAENGEDWCYYSFANGRRVHTTYWRCCKSSGAMAWEELAAVACTTPDERTLCVNLLGPGEVVLRLGEAGRVRLQQRTRYPFDGAIEFEITPEIEGSFELRLRIPSWAQGARLAVNGQAEAAPVEVGRYACLARHWRAGDRIDLHLPMQAQLHQRRLRNVQESRAPDGSPVRQEVLCHDHVAVSRGPLVYATGLIDGFKTCETLRLPEGDAAAFLQVLDDDAGAGPSIRLSPIGRAPLLLVPCYRADARRDGQWRLTWFSLAPQQAFASTNIP